MAWDAGAITGRLDLDHTSFDHGISESFTHAEGFGGQVREIMEQVNESFGEATGLTQFSAKIQSITAGFSEGPLLGGIHAAASLMGILRENTFGVAEEFHHIGEEAELAGVSSTFFSSLAPLAEEHGVGVDELSASFKFLARNMSDAASDPSGDVAKKFNEIGLSADFVKGHMGDMQGMFLSVAEAVKGLAKEEDKGRVLQDLMGRAGAALKPLMHEGSEGILDFQRTMENMHATVDEGDVKMGNEFAHQMTLMKAEWTSLENELARPVLGVFNEALGQIPGLVEGVKHAVEGARDLLNAGDKDGGSGGFFANRWSELVQTIDYDKHLLIDPAVNAAGRDGTRSGIKDVGYNPYGGAGYAGVHFDAINITVDPEKIGKSIEQKLKPHLQHAVTKAAAKSTQMTSSFRN